MPLKYEKKLLWVRNSDNFLSQPSNKSDTSEVECLGCFERVYHGALLFQALGKQLGHFLLPDLSAVETNVVLHVAQRSLEAIH